MTLITVTSVLLAIVYLLERLLKSVAVLHFFSTPDKPLKDKPESISILQPILSGDPHLEQSLQHNLALADAWKVEFLWLIDDDDREAEQVCQRLRARHPQVTIRIIALARGAVDESPKMLKLQHGLSLATGEVICVLDDDTQLPQEDFGLCLVPLKDPGVGLAFGLPYYVAFRTWPSSFVSCFVNANSLLTYVPYTYLTDPFTINGMFYVTKRERLQEVGDFDGLEKILADDFAVAKRFRQHGLRLVQTPLRHSIYTHVDSWRGYFRLLRRWFVFPRETIMRDLKFAELSVAYALAMVPTLIPLLLLVLALVGQSIVAWGALTLVIVTNLVVCVGLNRRYLYGATPVSRYGLFPLIQLLIPLQLLIAVIMPQKISWRGHVMQVEPGGTFRIVRHRSDANHE